MIPVLNEAIKEQYNRGAVKEAGRSALSNIVAQKLCSEKTAPDYGTFCYYSYVTIFLGISQCERSRPINS